jgi:nucleoside-diphosphate-sugar epimerase
MQRILVTGVGGNVGQYLAQKLHMDGYSVIGIYRNSKPKKFDYELIRSDLSENELNMENVDIVVHIAACLSGGMKRLIKDNIDATGNLLSFAEKNHVKTFIYMSTVSAYGNRDGQEVSVDSDVKNPSLYGCTKLIAENLVKEADIPTRLVIGLPRMLGPYVHLDNTKGSGFLTMTKKILQDEDVVCYIPEVLYNNYMHVDDLTDFVEKFIENGHQNGFDKVLMGAKDKLTMMEILSIIKEASQSRSKIISGTTETMPECSLVSIEKAISMGYSPKSSEEVLRTFVGEIT